MTSEAPVEPEASPRSHLTPVLSRAVAVAAFLAVVAYFALGMPGMDHGGAGTSGAMQGMEHSTMVDELAPEDFRAGLAGGDNYLVSVHPAAEALIPGTDADIAYDAVSAADLPSDKNTPLYFYCETGRMSEEAARAAADLGYADVSYLVGGTDAWTAAGYSLTQVAR